MCYLFVYLFNVDKLDSPSRGRTEYNNGETIQIKSSSKNNNVEKLKTK